jgi:dTDP-4-amino-4,6-dideoxygalactose transaminase
VFCDVLPGTLTVDPDQVEAAVTARTRAIMPVHLGHQMADMDRIVEIARRHSLALVEDCAHAHGQRWRDRGPAASASSAPSATSRPSCSPPGRAAPCSPTTSGWPAWPTR